MPASTELVRGARVESGLSQQVEHSTETMQASATAYARAEMEGAILVAKKFPRNEDDARQKLMRSCGRPRFADEVSYRYPRGQQEVIGLSVYFAREAARLWGNIRYGYYVVRDDEDERHIRCWAWDVETNTKVEFDDTFRKLVQRKQRGGNTLWVKPDERDLRELTGNRAARVYRNCILALLPEDLQTECQELAERTRQQQGAEDPDAARKKVVDAFGKLNIPVSEIERYLGHKLAVATPKELADLRAVWKSLHEGNSTWADYAPPETSGVGAGNGTGAGHGSGTGPVSPESLTKGRTTHGPRHTAPFPGTGSGKPSQPVGAFEGLSEAIEESRTLAALDNAIGSVNRAFHDGALTEDEHAELGQLAARRRSELQPVDAAEFDRLKKVVQHAATEAEVGYAVEDVAKASAAGRLSADQQESLTNLIEVQTAVVKGEQAEKPRRGK